ncbi:hypothetical protein C8J57DRAFT_945841, partial [Mycena rebaudengoi]
HLIDDDALDENFADISLRHPFAGSSIISGHLEAIGIHIPMRRIQESLYRVDAVGVIVRHVLFHVLALIQNLPTPLGAFRWNAVIRRRVYGCNALWHMDGNEKLRPWGFYVYGCVDG